MKMDFRDFCVSSFLLHSIAFLLLAVGSQQQMGQAESMIVSLSSDTMEKAPQAGRQTSGAAKEAVPPEPAMTAEKEIPGETEKPEVADEIPEEKPAVADNEGVIETENSQAANMAMARIHHFIAMHDRARSFVKSATLSIEKALHQEIANDSLGGLNEGTAEVTFYFNDIGGIGEVWGGSDSEKLKAALSRFDWWSVPSPGDFRVRMKALRVSIKIERGELSLLFSVL